jgi:predicted ATPase
VIVQRGQGNPFITSQILRDLRDVAASSQTGSAQSSHDEAQPLRSGSPSLGDGSQSLRDAAQWPLQAARVPFAVREIVLLKLNRLTPAARSLLCEAAAIGEQFDAQSLAPTEPDQPVAALLAECLENGMITPSQPGVFKFVHPMMREIAAEWLTPWRRQRVGSRSVRDGSQPVQQGGRLAPRAGFATETASEGNTHADPYSLVLSANRYAAHTA